MPAAVDRRKQKEAMLNEINKSNERVTKTSVPVVPASPSNANSGNTLFSKYAPQNVNNNIQEPKPNIELSETETGKTKEEESKPRNTVAKKAEKPTDKLVDSKKTKEIEKNTKEMNPSNNLELIERIRKTNKNEPTTVMLPTGYKQIINLILTLNPDYKGFSNVVTDAVTEYLCRMIDEDDPMYKALLERLCK